MNRYEWLEQARLKNEQSHDVQDVCEFYPTPEEETCVCGAGSDVSGKFLCTKEFSMACQWANEERKRK